MGSACHNKEGVDRNMKGAVEIMRGCVTIKERASDDKEKERLTL